MQRVHCSLKELDKVLQGKNPNEITSTIKQDETGVYLITMANWKQYITPLTSPLKREDPPKK